MSDDEDFDKEGTTPTPDVSPREDGVSFREVDPKGTSTARPDAKSTKEATTNNYDEDPPRSGVTRKTMTSGRTFDAPGGREVKK